MVVKRIAVRIKAWILGVSRGSFAGAFWDTGVAANISVNWRRPSLATHGVYVYVHVYAYACVCVCICIYIYR